ncbi:RibD family protein [Arthrobacter sp. A2-55]|uniref:RibD family protein n=1 Tax=Arthrobacter sp. A2-55 TaxID=2897337 RepID=UPI0021CDB5E8|nr:dihydrofolate reductase family protein [Arthrobacter sp. A2-55]MCU6482605.1 dihydrofolate reductase family protein [Arthrobacter sp. A2-55]
MAERPYTLLSCCMSLDGYIDDAGQDRLLLSNGPDFERVDAVRASCDAIMVGAATIRADNPRLLVRSRALAGERTARGLPGSPVKVTVTGAGRLDPEANFFADDGAQKLVYCASECAPAMSLALGGAATVVDAGSPVRMAAVSEDLHGRGIRRLMVEGGSQVHTQFLAGGLADELQLVVAPFFVGDSRAPRLVGDAAFPWNPGRHARLVETLPLGNAVLLRYALSDRFDGAKGQEPSAAGR